MVELSLKLFHIVWIIATTMLIHELGHIAVAHCCRVEIKRIGISRSGLYVQRARTSGWPEIAICMAGVASNFAVAFLFWRCGHLFALCNLSFAWVNLLPIPHSDGTHALQALRSMQQQEAKQQ